MNWCKDFLKLVFPYLKHEEFLSCRVVCKKWLKECTFQFTIKLMRCRTQQCPTLLKSQRCPFKYPCPIHGYNEILVETVKLTLRKKTINGLDYY